MVWKRCKAAANVLSDIHLLRARNEVAMLKLRPRLLPDPWGDGFESSYYWLWRGNGICFDVYGVLLDHFTGRASR